MSWPQLCCIRFQLAQKIREAEGWFQQWMFVLKCEAVDLDISHFPIFPVRLVYCWKVSISHWICHQFMAGLTHRDKQTSTLTSKPTGNLEWPIFHVLGLWEEAGVAGENPRRHRDNMQTQQRNIPNQNRKQYLLATSDKLFWKQES